MKPEQTLADLLELSLFLGEDHRGLAILGEGNTSAKIDQNPFLVKASGSCLQTLAADEVVECRFDKLLPMLDQDSLGDQEIEHHLFACRIDDDLSEASLKAITFEPVDLAGASR